MAINKKRLREFLKRINELQKSVAFEERWLTIAAKILNILTTPAFVRLSTVQQRQILQRLFRPEHQQFVDQVFRAFQETLNAVNTLYDDLGVEVPRDLPKIRAIERINRTYLGDYEEDAVKTIQRELRAGLAKNESYRQIRERLEKLGHKVTFFADTLARTQIKGYGRAVKTEKARLGEVFFYQYVGIIRPTTRPFCEALIDTTHHINDINAMRNGNLEPVLQYCGGWNCYHDWEPDPFATESTAAKFKTIGEGKKKMVIKTEANIEELIAEYPKKVKKKKNG